MRSPAPILLALLILSPSAAGLNVLNLPWLSIAAPELILPGAPYQIEGELHVYAGIPQRRIDLYADGAIAGTKVTNLYGKYAFDRIAPGYRADIAFQTRESAGLAESDVIVLMVREKSTPPRDLVGAVRPNVSTIDLAWNEPLDSGGLPVTSYRVWRDSGSGFVVAATVETRSYVDTFPNFGGTYDYRVTAVTAVGESDASNVIRVSVPPEMAQITASIRYLQACVPFESGSQCVNADAGYTVHYSPQDIAVGPRAQGRLTSMTGQPVSAPVRVHVNISWDGEVRASRSKLTGALNDGMIDAIVYPAAVWSDLPFGDCRTILVEVRNTVESAYYYPVSATASGSWRICHDLAASQADQAAASVAMIISAAS